MATCRSICINTGCYKWQHAVPYVLILVVINGNMSLLICKCFMYVLLKYYMATCHIPFTLLLGVYMEKFCSICILLGIICFPIYCSLCFFFLGFCFGLYFSICLIVLGRDCCLNTHTPPPHIHTLTHKHICLHIHILCI